MIEADNGQPEYFDHGRWRNLEWYGQTKPPIYDASRINSTKMAFIYTSGDWLNSIESVELLKSKLKGKSIKLFITWLEFSKTFFISVKLLDDYCVPDKSYNHVDLIWAKDVGQLVNKRVLKILSSV